jgi:type I restriction enzyme S subunit
MDAQQFLAEFEHIANAPGGVQKLRELILNLAVQGRLLMQLSTDESAEDFLARCDKHKKQLIAGKYSRRPVQTGKIHATEKIFSLPFNWKWTRLGILATKLTDGSHNPPKGVVHGYPMISSQNVLDGKIDFSNPTRLLSEEDHMKEDERTQVKPGDVLLTIVGSIGRSAVVPVDAEKFSMQRSVAVISSPMVPEYLSIQLRSPIARAYFDTHGKGTAQKGIYLAKLSDLPITVPPFKEQSRIVAKVDELMALCDKLEAQQQERRKLQNNLRQSTLQAVANANNPNELQLAWSRLSENFGKLFHAPEDVKDLRKLVSELAIRGALDVLSEPTDSTNVEAYLAELAGKKSGKRFAKAIRIEEDIALPNGWRWVLLEDLLANSESGWSPKCDSEPRRNGEWGVLKVSAVTWGVFNPEENKRLPLTLEARPEYEVKPGDFMLSRANTAELVARSVIAPQNCPEKLLMSDKIVRLEFLDNQLKPWVNLVNNSELARSYYKARATGTSDSMRNVSRQVIHELPIPLPSLEVQERVLKALDRLMSICDELERQSSNRVKLSAQLSVTAVSSLIGLAAQQDKEQSFQLPQTETTE